MGFFLCILIGCVLYIPTPMRTETCEAEDEFGMTYYHYCSDACCDYTSPPACCESAHSNAYKHDYALRTKRSIHRVKTPRYYRYGPDYYTTYRWVYYTKYYTVYKKVLSRGAITGIVFGSMAGLGILCMLLYGIGVLCYKAYEKCRYTTCCECTLPCKRHVTVRPTNEINSVSHGIRQGVPSGTGAVVPTVTPIEIPDIPKGTSMV